MPCRLVLLLDAETAAHFERSTRQGYHGWWHALRLRWLYGDKASSLTMIVMPYVSDIINI